MQLKISIITMMKSLMITALPLLTCSCTEEDYFCEALTTFLWFVIPIIVLGIICILLRVFTKIPDYIFRKILHLIAAGMITILVVIPTHWWVSEIVMGICILGLSILLIIFEHTSAYQKFFIEKYKHEVLFSYLIFSIVVTSLIAFFWGFRGDTNRFLVIVALLSWAFGDASASIVGHLLGKHPLSGKMIEGTKSVEGSIACFIFAFSVSLILLLTLIHYVWWLAILEALAIGVVVSFAELFTKRGLDNFTCPIGAAIILFLFSLI